jgi:hypothetical protein
MFVRMSTTPHEDPTIDPIPDATPALQELPGAPDDGRLEIPVELSTEFDGFPPPDEPINVACLHCGREYRSDTMIPPDGPRTPIMQAGFWWCPTPDCDAGGFGIDIFPTDPSWTDPTGLLVRLEDCDEEDFEFDPFDDDDDEDDDNPLAELTLDDLEPLTESSPRTPDPSSFAHISAREVQGVAQDAARHRGEPSA